jgi:uncharacterized protein DUF2834
MSPRRAYLLLCVLGLLLPYSQFLPWVLENGFDLPKFVTSMFANRIAGFFALDVIVSAGAVMVLALTDGRRLGVKPLWAPVVGTLLVGVSFGLPLYLYLRESRSPIDAD